MPGTIAGGRKARDTTLKKHGKDFYKKMGAKGGSAKVTKGFGANRELAAAAGRKGGKVSRKRK